jgi:hypothetical protein
MVFDPLVLPPFNKLFGAFVLEVELNILFNVINTILEVDFSIGLKFVLTNTNDYGRQT